MLEVPFVSPRPLWSVAQYNPKRELGAVAPACPSRPWWWLLAAAVAGGAVTYYASQPKPKARR